MALTAKEQVRYWGLATAAFFVALWVLGDVILPFVLGGALAYLLDPIADWLQRIGLNRVMATIVITLFTMILFVLVGLLVVPTLVQQTAGLFETAPKLVQQFSSFLTERFPELLDSESRISRSLMA